MRLRVIIPLASCLLLASTTGQAVTFGWENEFSDGQEVTSGSQATAGGVTLGFTTNVVSDDDGGTFDLALFTGDAAFITVNHGESGAHMGYARLSFDNEDNDPADYVELTVSFDVAVVGLQFSVLDVDSGSSISWDDGVEVTYNGGLNVRSTPSLFTLPGGSPSVVLDNEAGFEGFEGLDGVGASATEEIGNVVLDFGLVPVTSFTVRYFSTDDAALDPVEQLVGVSDLRFIWPAPEPGTASLLALGLVLTAAIRPRRR